MSDSELPKTSGDFVVKFIWGVIVFALGFEGIVKTVELELVTAGWCFLAATVLGITLAYRVQIVAFLREKMTQIFIILAIVCAMGLGVAVGGLIATRGFAKSEAGQTGRITWNFDQALRGESFFLNTFKTNNEGLKIAGFGFHGKNTSADPVSAFSGYVRSDITNVQLPFYIMAQEANAPTDILLPFSFLYRLSRRKLSGFQVLLNLTS